MEIDHRLLTKYWEGTCTAEERRVVEEWMAQGAPEHDVDFDSSIPATELKAAMWLAIVQESDFETYSDARKERHYIRYAWMAAASLLLGISYLFWPFARDITSVDDYKEVVVPMGKKAHFRLPDSSLVYLNAGSSIRYPEQFDPNERHVIVSGEAYFSIARHAGHPFVAQTAHTKVYVLGTEFVLRSYAREKYTSLVLVEGKVLFTADHTVDSLILTANDRAIYDGQRIDRDQVNTRNFTAWKDNRLVFDGEPLAAIVPVLERWYNVHIDLRDASLGKNRVKASFDNVSLASVLHDLTFALNLNYTLNGKEVMIYK